MKISIVSRVNNTSGGVNAFNLKNTNKPDEKNLQKSETKQVAFGRGIISDSLGRVLVTRRAQKLKNEGMSDSYAEKLGQLPLEQFKRAKELYKIGVYEECIEDVSSLDKDKYEQAWDLIEDKIIDENLYPIASLEEQDFQKVMALKAQGVDVEFLTLFADLKPSQLKYAKKLMACGTAPVEAVHLAMLNGKQKKVALSLMKKNINVEDASTIAAFDKKERKRSYSLIKQGVVTEDAIDIAALDDESYKRTPELLKLNVGDDNVYYFAKLSEEDYYKALKMFKEGVQPEFVPEIIELENARNEKSGQTEQTNEDEPSVYYECRDKGYSRTSSYSISLLSDDEVNVLCSLIKQFPQMKTLLKDDYDINIVKFQNTKENEAILTKDVRTEFGTKIKFLKTFSEDGATTENRVEEYANHSTSSRLKKSNIFRIKYGPNGSIKEMLELVADEDRGGIKGVSQTKVSDVLNGAFVTDYYDIKDLTPAENNGKEELPKSCAKPVSYVQKNADGSVEYGENFKYANYAVDRFYSEKRNGDLTLAQSLYKYKITDKDGNVLMNIERSYQQNDDGSILNTINGVKYTIEFDDDNHCVTVSDGKKSELLDFSDKLYPYSKEKVWNIVKTLQVDALVSVFDNVRRLNYSRETDSYANGYTGVIASSDTATMLHEIGHFEDYRLGNIADNEEFQKVYDEEMAEFIKKMPFNEQAFIQYFSPRADMNAADGKGEFVAETNILFNTYGNPSQNLKTRAQFLVRYFPQTIAKVAEILGKTSTTSVLEEN